jgi:hypothetical protein
MFFDFNGENYTLSKATTPAADIFKNEREIFTLSNGTNEINIRLDFFHNYENQNKNVFYNYYDDAISDKFKKNNCYTITNAIDPEFDNELIIFNDFLFNRTKGCYSQYPLRDPSKILPWYDGEQLSYVVPTHSYTKKKIYVSPSKTHHGFRKYRGRLVETLKKDYLKLGYLGCYDSDPTLFLYPQIEFPHVTDIETIEQQYQKDVTNNCTDMTWWHGGSPAHNEYYKNTFISIYGETVETGNSVIVTEKTFDPLIKGHFVLPFSSVGTIRHLKEYHKFKFPDFIDYSYDDIQDDELRYQIYEKEVKRLLAIDIDTWRQHWQDNFIDVIRYNQLVFYERPFDRVNFYKLLERTV